MFPTVLVFSLKLFQIIIITQKAAEEGRGRGRERKKEGKRMNFKMCGLSNPIDTRKGT